MGQNVTAEDLITKIEGLERRLRALETSPRMFATTQHGGTYELDNEDGSQTFFKFGTFTDKNGNTQFGMTVQPTGVNGFDVLQLGMNGLLLPAMPIPMKNPFSSQVIVGGAFSTAWAGQANWVTTNALQITVLAQAVDGLSGGTFRVRNAVVGGANTSTVTVGVGDTTGFFQTFNWLHQQPIATGPFQPQVEATGTGNGIRIYQPDICAFNNGDYLVPAATVTGL